MSRTHILAVAYAHADIAKAARDSLPAGDEKIAGALTSSADSLHSSMEAANDGSIESAMHLHDSVRHMERAVKHLAITAPQSEHLLGAARALIAAKTLAAEHERDII
jgi:conjugal transfer/entry exclusion protein